MKNNLIKYILILSLLLNFSFLGAAGYSQYKRSHTPPVSPANCDPGRSYLFQQLSLKPEQIKLFQQKALSFHDLLGKKRQEVNQMRGSLFRLIRADNPDSQTLQETILKINRFQAEMQKMVVAHMLEFKALLDKDQQKKFLDLIEGAMAKRKGAGYPVCP
jgi:Spy/CpxP family protein refolding chaperone